MTKDQANASNERSEQLPVPDYEGMDWGVLIFLVLGVVALSLPYIATSFVGGYWAAAVAVAVLVLWFAVMPTTCMSGGLICSLVAMAIMFNTIGFVLVAAIRFVVSLFS